jgi:predicted transcriptional regulator
MTYDLYKVYVMKKVIAPDTTVNTLGELRKTQGVFSYQTEIAEKLSVAQSEISRVEQRGDHRVSTLKRYVEQGLGGKLFLLAEVLDHEGKTVLVQLNYGA